MRKKSGKASSKPRGRICFIPGCREVIAGDKTEFFCAKHVRQLVAVQERKRGA